MSHAVIVGMDIGGTKTAIRIEDVAGRVILDTVVPSGDWDAEPFADGIAWVHARLDDVLASGQSVSSLGIGAQGLDNPEVVSAYEAGLAARGFPTIAVNDAGLLVPAAGLDHGLAVIAGTGAIGVGRTAEGAFLSAGGWGWVIGDEAGAPGIVREAVKAALHAHEDGEADDGLLSALFGAFEVPDAERLARAVNDHPTMDNWGAHAPAVFAAADSGSGLAISVIDGAAAHLAVLVDRLRTRGAIGSHVVAAGSVIVKQTRLSAAFAQMLERRHPDLQLVLLDVPPVAGAVALARTLARS